jgi:hypothetical protein
MRKSTIRRLELLERDCRSLQEKELSSWRTALFYIKQIVLAYYLEGLESNDDRPSEAYAKALNYGSSEEFFEAVHNQEMAELERRSHHACRLFAKVGLEFDNTPRNELFDALVTMVNELPEHWLNWLWSNLRAYCADADVVSRSNLPSQLSDENLFLL